MFSVVVVDDDESLRTLIRHRLERTGEYTVVGEAVNTTDALALAEAQKPHVVLLDLLLGDEVGADIIGDLLRTAPQTMIAVLTALSAEEHEEIVRAAGAFVFYEKTTLTDLPADLREDLRTFRQALDGTEIVAPSAITRRP